MKQRILIYFLFIAAMIGIHAMGTKVSAQEDIAGGYGDMSVTDRDARQAAAFAVKTRSSKTSKKITLIKILKAEVQVVAGLNFRVCMRVREGKGRVQTVTAVVYRNLRNKRSLSRWKSGGCSDL